jgi:nucleoside-diphosphate-sugar epimerase
MNRVLITGGGGFVGKALLKLLLKHNIECAVLGRNSYPELQTLKVQCYRGDICDKDFILATVKDFDVVFHVAAMAGIWGNKRHFYNINVVGTENIIEACLKNKIPTMVYTSTPSVVFSGDDILDGNESLPYSNNFLCEYARTKVIAEKAALTVDQTRLKTCAIRPHLIWGPGDPHLIPRLIDRGRKQNLKIVGEGQNLVDITYIDNVAMAHFLAAKNLLTSGSSSGKAYFIGQERPVKLWEWINELFRKLEIPQVEKKISLSAAYSAGRILETVHKLIIPNKEPVMTRFLAEQLAKSHYFSHESAHRDFGYTPQISIEEGMEKLLHWLKTQ